ncbi:hypothetical protein MHN00_03270 [Alteromonas sp. Cnat2-8]|uniref:hypothetical protein n=1 Tax=Alteromonas TaxID=226 RepID=UPI001EF23681|nr:MULTISPECIES: hypothetical protein [Alteromonas]MEC9429178.1 hypothetical protein [Pseudomonadota bacterium]MCG7639292.1 hypothetical protein [Alteromonas sp. CNT1-28]MCG7652564.1 hypothetical protein [Alteromonas sp. Cnat2-8]MCG7814958.1 hypothetical protein [Alteromonas sp. MCA-1]MCZ4242112.1 hypothetical protein [Alteromonas macleodii]
MTTVIVADIFGKTPALEELANIICKNHLIVDPYDGQYKMFQTESDAYEYFSSNIGLGNYSKHLINSLTNLDSSVNLVGFSIGAAAIWNLSESIASSRIKKAICFYGSQIRNNRKVVPLFPVTLVFPKTEKHFSVPELISELRNTERTKIRQVPYFHGFMNKCSTNFNLQGYESELRTLAANAI